MDIKEYFNKKRELQSRLLGLLDDEDGSDDDIQAFLDYIQTSKIKEDQNEMLKFIQLILRISENHHRTPSFFSKIYQILNFIEKEIKQTFSNYTNIELYNFFKDSKQILLFLINSKILKLDDDVISVILEKSDKFYFFNEIKSMIEKNDKKEIEKEISNIKNFDEKRSKGENDSYVCQLIRQDLVEEFVSYVTRTNLSLSKKIARSIFETNSFLIDKEPTLIEYAAFFGSIQIFHYLRMEGVPLTPSLWLYSIHARNADLIHLLEENHVDPEGESYDEYLEEAIKCHHNEIANYIQNNLMKTFDDFDDFLSFGNVSEIAFDKEVTSYAFRDCNYEFLPEKPDNPFLFSYACKYNYLNLVKLFLKTREFDVNYKIILKTKFF